MRMCEVMSLLPEMLLSQLGRNSKNGLFYMVGWFVPVYTAKKVQDLLLSEHTISGAATEVSCKKRLVFYREVSSEDISTSGLRVESGSNVFFVLLGLQEKIV